jgi:hypothetical protein
VDSNIKGSRVGVAIDDVLHYNRRGPLGDEIMVIRMEDSSQSTNKGQETSKGQTTSRSMLVMDEM